METSTGASGETARFGEWLVLHQPCVNVRVQAEEMAIRKSTKMTFDWASGFRFIDNANVNYDNYQFHPTGNVECRECGFAQAKGSPPQHAIDCPFA